MLTRRLFTRAALAAPVIIASTTAAATSRRLQVGDDVPSDPEAWWSLPAGTLVSAEFEQHRWWYLTNGKRGAYIGTQRLPHNGVVFGGFYEPWLSQPGPHQPQRYVIRAMGLPYIPDDKEADAAVARAIAPFVNPDDPPMKRGVVRVQQPRMTWTLRDTDPNAIVAAFNKEQARRAAEPIRRALAMARR